MPCKPRSWALLMAVTISCLVLGLDMAAAWKASRKQTSDRWVYVEGFAPGWGSSPSLGCKPKQCDFMYNDPTRNGSEFVIRAVADQWSALILEKDAGLFYANRTLKFWMRGNGVARTALSLRNSKESTESQRLQFSDPTAMHSGIFFATSPSDQASDWINVKVDLQQLAASSDGGSNAGWNQIVFQDVSGLGFTLYLDDILMVNIPFDMAAGSNVPVTAPKPTVTPIRNLDMVSGNISTQRFIMRLKDSCANATSKAACCGGVASLCKAAQGQGKLKNASALFKTFSVKSKDELQALLSASAHIADYVEPDLPAKIQGFRVETRISAAGGDVPSWGLDRIDQLTLPLDGSYEPGPLDGENTHVFVLDTGLRATHQDFVGRIGDGASVFGNSYEDDNGHGTHVAGIVMGSIHGVARKAILHPVKVFDASGAGAFSDVIDGLGWVKTYVQQNGIKSAVVSMSLAGPRAASMNDAVDDLSRAGIVVVVAAGNDNGGDACSVSPASAGSAITVGAISEGDVLAPYSNVGACLNLFAPGTYINSAGIAADDAVATYSGTSQAGPHVAGGAAMYLENRPGAATEEVKSAIVAAAVQETFDAGSPNALLNVLSDRLEGAAPPSQSPSSSPGPGSGFTPDQGGDTGPPSGVPVNVVLAPGTDKPSWCAGCTACLICS